MRFKTEFLNGYKDPCLFPLLGILLHIEKDLGICLTLGILGFALTLSLEW